MKTLKQVKEFIVTVIGFSMIAIGLAMVVLPGPAFIFIPAGLAILATEFIWARKLLQKVREKLKKKDEIKEKPPKNE
ncbi:MAG: PGPGW domain-containing protein [Syntrophorhabdus sp.]